MATRAAMKIRPGVTVAVDFDGTCVTHEYPLMGRDIGAQRVLKRIVAEGGRLILWTMRSGQRLQEAIQWYGDNGIPLYGVQYNPTQYEWTDSPKALANIYIDDSALGCPCKSGLKGERPHVDWEAVEEVLWPTAIPAPTTVGGWLITLPADDALSAILMCDCLGAPAFSLAEAISDGLNIEAMPEGIRYWVDIIKQAEHFNESDPIRNTGP